MAKFTWQERVAEIDAELTAPEGKPMPGLEAECAAFASKRQADLKAERAEIVLDPSAWTRTQEEWERKVDLANLDLLFA